MDIRLSTKDIEAGQTEDGGYTKAQLEVLGIPWQPPKGWKKSLVGKVVSADDYIKFLKLKDR